ncbi:AAA family ATPase [Spongorhabdus nitratireducens]
MDNNELYYVVGIAGSGKTSVCKQLAESVYDGVAIQTSGRFKDYIKAEGIKDIKTLNAISEGKRESLINDVHRQFELDKSANPYTFLDGHMLVKNSQTGKNVNAMPTKNRGITTGIIFLNTPSRLISDNVRRDNRHNSRKRVELDIHELMALSEAEFQAAEDYCLRKKLKFGILENIDISRRKYSSVQYINNYYLPYDFRLRSCYLSQFDQNLLPSELRHQHYTLGSMLVSPFLNKTGMEEDEYQIMSVPRSGNFIANGFASNFNGRFLQSDCSVSFERELDFDKPIIIIDSVIDSGNTIHKILKRLPDNFNQPVHVICLAINIKSLDLVKSMEATASFHCLGFSNKEVRPERNLDMGARLFGTLEKHAELGLI